MNFPGPLVVALAEAVAELRRLGSHEVCNRLTTAIAESSVAPEPTHPGPSVPPKRSRVRTEEDRAKDRERQARLRESRALSRPVSRAVTGVTSGVTSLVTFRDTSRDHACLPEEEEKRKVLDSGEFSAESGNSLLSESSQMRARHGVTSDVTKRDVTRDATRALRRLQDATATTFDLHSWLSELQRIAAKPEAEFAKVLASIATDPWVKAGPSRAHPGHVIKHWGQYLDPPKPVRRGGMVPVSEDRSKYNSPDPEWLKDGTN